MSHLALGSNECGPSARVLHLHLEQLSTVLVDRHDVDSAIDDLRRQPKAKIQPDDHQQLSDNDYDVSQVEHSMRKERLYIIKRLCVEADEDYDIVDEVRNSHDQHQVLRSK